MYPNRLIQCENSILLDAFQAEAALAGPGQVKGLFCTLPKQSLEHVIVLGFGKKDEAYELKKFFKESWYGSFDKDGTSYAEKLVNGSTPCRCPIDFSRYRYFSLITVLEVNILNYISFM